MAAVDPTESLELTVNKDTGHLTCVYTSNRRGQSARSAMPEPGVFVKDPGGQVVIEATDEELFLLVAEDEEEGGYILELPHRMREVRISTKLATAVLAYFNTQVKDGTRTPVTQSVKFAYPDFKPQVTGSFISKAEQKASAEGLATVSAFNPSVPRELVEGKMADFLGLPKTKKAGKRRGSRRTKKRSTRRRGRRSM